jgi:hypothetical protein
MADLPVIIDATAVHATGNAWLAGFSGLTDSFLSGFDMKIFDSPISSLPFFAYGFFLKKDACGTSTLQIRFFDKSSPHLPSDAKPTVQLSYPAA